jgi:uncharacterized membrane protein
VLTESLDTTFDAGTVNAGSWLLQGLWCLGVLALGLKAPQTPRLAQLGFLIVAGFLLVNKVYSPQYVLWLLPLAVMARPRWRDQIIWQAGEVLYFASVWWYLGGALDSAGGGDAGFYWLAILVRMLCELWLVAIVARDVVRPERDPVERRGGVAHPDAEPVADLRNAWSLRQEQHGGLHVGWLREQALLAVDGVRRPYEPCCVQSSASQGGRPRAERRLTHR